MEEDYTPAALEFSNQSVVIIDPAYVMPDMEDAEKADYGEDMTKVGYTKCHTAHNGYGDGCWKVVNMDGRDLGEIWADSGQVGVFLTDEVKKLYGHSLVDGCILLQNFTGTVSFTFKEKTFYWNEPYVATFLVLHVTGMTADGEIDFTVDYSKRGGWQ